MSVATIEQKLSQEELESLNQIRSKAAKQAKTKQQPIIFPV
jgi:hypothetical protein